VPSNSGAMVTLDAKSAGRMHANEMTSPDERDRYRTVLNVETEDRMFSVLGTSDEIIEFGASFMAAIYSWVLTNNLSDEFLDGFVSARKVNINGNRKE
jgi:hypothetical protein